MNKFQVLPTLYQIQNEHAVITVAHVDGPAAAETYAFNIADRLNKYDSLKTHGAYYMAECQKRKEAHDHDVAALTQGHKLQRVQCAGIALFVGVAIGLMVAAMMITAARGSV